MKNNPQLSFNELAEHEHYVFLFFNLVMFKMIQGFLTNYKLCVLLLLLTHKGKWYVLLFTVLYVVAV